MDAGPETCRRGCGDRCTVALQLIAVPMGAPAVAFASTLLRDTDGIIAVINPIPATIGLMKLAG